jgi:Fe-S cluster assembly protein SufB
MSSVAVKGLNSEIITEISNLRNEPEWLLQWRLKAYRKWQTMAEPHWLEGDYKPIDYQNIQYFAEPTINPFTGKEKGEAMDEGTRSNLTKLGISISEQTG